jgi:predicted anti-sigma-YlaC factor YlaD
VDCNQVLDQLGDYLDEEARAELCRAIEEHLKQCRDCRVYVDTVKKTIVLYQADSKVELPVPVSGRLREVLVREYSRNSRPAD